MKSSTFELGLRSTTLQSSTTRPSKLYNYLCKTKKMNDFAVPRVFLTPSSFCKQCYSKYFHIWSERWELSLNIDFSSDTTIVLAELEYIMEVIKQALKFKYGSQYAHCFLTFGRPRRQACAFGSLCQQHLGALHLMRVWWWTQKAAENKPWIVAVKHWRYQKENAI